MQARQPSDRTPQARVLADDHDDVGQHQREQVSVLKHGHQLSCRVAAKGVDNQMDAPVHERVHHLDRAMQSLQFGGRRAGDRTDGVDHGGDGWPHLGFREFTVRHRRGELVQPVLLGGVKHPGGTDNCLELQADQAECSSRQAGFDQDPLRDRMLDRRTTEGQADGRASGRCVPAGS